MENVFFVHLDTFLFSRGAPFFQNRFEPFFGVFLFVTHAGGAFKILVLNGALFFGFDVVDVGLEPFHFGRASHGANARARAGLIH